MQWKLWLAQPETERSLGRVLYIMGTIAALWTLAAGYGMWSTHAALAAAQLAVLSQSNQISQIARDLPGKRRQALKAAEVKGLPSPGAAGAELTEELADLARVAGAEVRGVRIGDGGQTAAQAARATATPEAAASVDSSPPGTPSTTASAPAGGNDMTHEEFECNITGEYPSLTRFLRGLTDSHQIIDITSLQVTQGNVKSQTDSPRLEMKLSGTVYETADKS